MIDKQSGLKIRKTINGMRKEDNLDTPPQHRRMLTEEEIQSIIAAAPRREREAGEL